MGRILCSVALNLAYGAITTALSVWGILFCRTEARAIWLGRSWGRAMLATARACGIQLEISGAEHLPRDGAALIASAHQSAFDTMIWMAVLPRGGFVLKRELLSLPLFGRLLARAGMIAVDRASGAGAMRTLLRGATRACAEGRQMVIFPQGTRVDPAAAPAPLHPGVAAMAMRTGLPVLPAWLDSGRCWPRRGFWRYPGTVHLHLLPPLPAHTPRETLMATLAGVFAADRPGPGDNSGDQAPDRLTFQNKSATQPYDE